MPNIQNAPIQGYSVAGYVPGDRIGAGVVVDPATLSAKEGKDTKLVNIDLNLNGAVDAQDDKVLVKLPPKGFVPADWKGSSTLSSGQKLSEAGGRMAMFGLVGGVVGAFVGAGVGSFAEEKVFGAVLAKNPAGLAVGTAVALLAAGVTIGYHTNSTISGLKQDAEAARSSAVPDLVQPKYILNQYMLQQSGAQAAIGQLSTIGK